MNRACFHCTAAAPADGAPWPQTLHWVVRVVPENHPDLAFAASLLAYALEHDGLTPRQEKYARQMVARVKSEFAGSDGLGLARPVDLAKVPTAGEA